MEALVPTSTNHTEHVGNEDRVLIAVVTAPQHEDVRHAIRNTWGNLTAKQQKRVDVRFFVGELPPTLNNADKIEANLNRSDVIRLEGFIEHYNNLTAKAKGIFSWAASQNYSALMKVDDDSFVRVDVMLAFIDSHNESLSNIYAGHINRPEYGECVVHKNPTSKWYMYDQYPFDTFPEFADGPGFLLGSRALKFLSQNSKNLVDYRCDDAAVGIWTAELGLEKIEMPLSIYDFGCSSQHVLTNPVSAGEMFTLSNFPQICESGYNIEVCLDQPCLCKGHPDRARCWQDIIDQPYRDIIPRL
eukprot:c587_g1_i1.p1 GENE.c587_g1_i1~~c587_g1_i1.p1  ORF type:complete len:315 (-),score=70.43 c587_g1_i1:67-969(-)